jgi:hypothetical protein
VSRRTVAVSRLWLFLAARKVTLRQSLEVATLKFMSVDYSLDQKLCNSRNQWESGISLTSGSAESQSRRCALRRRVIGIFQALQPRPPSLDFTWRGATIFRHPVSDIARLSRKACWPGDSYGTHRCASGVPSGPAVISDPKRM